MAPSFRHRLAHLFRRDPFLPKPGSHFKGKKIADFLPGKLARRWKMRRVRRAAIEKLGGHFPLGIVTELYPPLRDAMVRNGFRFRSAQEWVSSRSGHRAPIPHLLLEDSHGDARFVLGYTVHRDFLVINYIQRNASAYDRLRQQGGNPIREDLQPQLEEEERRKTAEFKREFGIFPSEALVQQFTFMARDLVAVDPDSLTILLKPSLREINQKIYAPLIDRFFSKKPLPFSGIRGNFYSLSLEKRRVRQALGLPVKK